MLEIKFKKLEYNAELPSYAKDGDAGLDLTASNIIKDTDDVLWLGTGIAVEIPEGYEGQIRPRSSISKKDLILANGPGTIDSGYRGEIQVRFQRLRNGGKSGDYEVGEKIAQLVIKPVPLIIPAWTEELSETVRGEGGFGHTGR